jgi:hypothetical protein
MAHPGVPFPASFIAWWHWTGGIDTFGFSRPCRDVPFLLRRLRSFLWRDESTNNGRTGRSQRKPLAAHNDKPIGTKIQISCRNHEPIVAPRRQITEAIELELLMYLKMLNN